MSGECNQCGEHTLECKCELKESYWIKVDKSAKCPNLPILISDGHEEVFVGHTSFDYYDAEYWFPMPKYENKNDR